MRTIEIENNEYIVLTEGKKRIIVIASLPNVKSNEKIDSFFISAVDVKKKKMLREIVLIERSEFSNIIKLINKIQ